MVIIIGLLLLLQAIKDVGGEKHNNGYDSTKDGEFAHCVFPDGALVVSGIWLAPGRNKEKIVGDCRAKLYEIGENQRTREPPQTIWSIALC
ncbi:hypothetical protein KQX54_002861 [Cotesia glomerata]|uniref:Uncharacterized protein n=1 Tax=Cotesia glomerata TaxID=32391 RepID=A0AAV7IIX1_COTGL|nr:hypothetical protein KQX54_002861 [Cotesia glomerata]